MDWSRTQAYAIGLNGIYLNLVDREHGGIVSAAERDQVRDNIAKKLLALRIPYRRERGRKHLFSRDGFSGRCLQYSPDLFVGFHRGYRASWQTALGECRRPWSMTTIRRGLRIIAWRPMKYRACCSAIARSRRRPRSSPTSPPRSWISSASRRPRE